MTAFRPDLRATVRLRLEDQAASPLWTDAHINSALAVAINEYGTALPDSKTHTVAVAADATEITLPVELTDAERIIAVLLPDDRQIAPGPIGSTAPTDNTGAQLDYWREGRDMLLSRPVLPDEAGTWTIYTRRPREALDTDLSAQPIDAGDEPIVTALAAAVLLRQRAVADAKRNVRSAIGRQADEFSQEAGALIKRRRHVVRSGWLA